MASETLKALLMIALFGALETALYFPHIRASQWRKRLHQAVAPSWPAVAPTHYALRPVKVRHGFRRR